VLFFITTDCPISNSYAPEVSVFARNMDKGGLRNLFYVDPELTVADVKNT